MLATLERCLKEHFAASNVSTLTYDGLELSNDLNLKQELEKVFGALVVQAIVVSLGV